MIFSHKILLDEGKRISVDKSSIFELDCCSIVNSMQHFDCLENPRLRKWLSYKKFIVFGTGGSSLGGQCIHAIFGSKSNVKFVNNLDSDSLHKILDSCNIDDTGFLCISKSGETLETICQTILMIGVAKKNRDFSDHFVVITEDKQSSLKSIAEEYNFLCLDHPKKIGGRFSVFSIVGMLPAILCNVDPNEIYSGARNVLNSFRDVEDNNIIDGATFIARCYEKNITEHVSFLYSDKLSSFGDWLAQLYAESTGKNCIGITPLKAIGAVDQHSQLQLYLDGTKNKSFTFFIEKQKDIELSLNGYIPDKFSYLRGKMISDVFSAQSQATISSVLQRGLPVRKVEFEPITPKILGGLFMHFMLEVMCVCRALNVNAFDQPAVETGKLITARILSE